MKREIKFRAWDGEIMHHVDTICFPVGGVKWFGPGVGQGWATSNMEQIVPNSTLMQFTGLHDKNGTEVYEGDVIEYKSSMESGTGKIEWWTGGFVIIWIKQQTAKPSIVSPLFYFGCSDEITALGNIYEHPHLLNNS